MIITRTPLRVSFAGGCSDFPGFYRHHGGAVVSAAIQKYVYVALHPFFLNRIRIKYSQSEDVASPEEVQHPVIRECLRRVPVAGGIEIASMADVPDGTGLGSSSSFTVGLLHALYAYRGQEVSKERLAEEACRIEIDLLSGPVGKQDQYAAAHGDLNFIRFNPDDSVTVAPIPLEPHQVAHLEQHLKLYYLGGRRLVSEILDEIQCRMDQPDQRQRLQRVVGLAEDLREAFAQDRLERIASTLTRGWEEKKRLAERVSNPLVEAMMARLLELGGLGARLMGGGANGFILLYADNHADIQKHLDCPTLPFQIDRWGTQVIFRY
nr:D-glycero-D-manno-heptose 7-phosphate kinase [uncultured bacterium]